MQSRSIQRRRLDPAQSGLYRATDPPVEVGHLQQSDHPHVVLQGLSSVLHCYLDELYFPSSEHLKNTSVHVECSQPV